MPNELLFFNDSGDAMNINPDTNTGLYTGTLFFDQSSSDTFKTIDLFLLQHVDAFNFSSINGDTNLQRFQLFNENRFTFNSSIYFTQSVSNIIAVNNNSDFYSKWIYGENFEKMYPIGSCIILNNIIFEFTNLNNTYTVVGNQKNAIMIISNIDNVTFNNLYLGLTISNISISGVNSIGIYDYRRGFIDQLSNWNEQDFYTLLYNNKKLTIVQGKTQSIVTVKTTELTDRIYYNYYINNLSYTQSDYLTGILTLNTNLPTIYNGGINIISNNIYFNNPVPIILKPNTSFVINNSILNTEIITVGVISSFLGNINTIYYATQSQVLFNNLIYQCILGYTQSPSTAISPTNSNYWTSSITYLPSLFTLNDETILNTPIHLTTNILAYSQSFTNSNVSTMAYFAQNYAAQFKQYNIDLFYENNTLNANSIYASNYASVDFYVGSSTVSIVNKLNIIENIIPTIESLSASNYIDYNENNNYKYSIAILNIDSFGIILTLNNQIYQISTDFIYDGLNVNTIATIDKTLRNFQVRYFETFNALGINLVLESTLYDIFPFYKDTITLETAYPNVPINLIFEMGVFANYYIKHSSILFNDLGNYFNININGTNYGQTTISASSSIFIPDINATLTNWVKQYSIILNGYGIYVSNIRNLLYFNLKEPNTSLVYSINVNKILIPGTQQYIITNYINGNIHTLISGNEIILSATSSQNFEISGFATGMAMSVNNIFYVYDNQEYNILYVDTIQLGLSYKGPFWGTLANECTVSGFPLLSFYPNAFSASACSASVGNFNTLEFSSAFSINTTSQYTTYSVIFNDNNLYDLLYIDEFRKVYVAATDIISIDAETFNVLNTFSITASKIVFNNINKYVYAIDITDSLYIIDPITDILMNSINISIGFINDIIINQNNGDIYITLNNVLYIYNYNNSLINSIPLSGANKMVYNIIDNYIYITGNKLWRINSNTYDIVNLGYNVGNPYIFTEPVYGSVYFWNLNIFSKLTDLVLTTPTPNISELGNGFNDLIYNNYDGNVYLSRDSSDFYQISSSDNVNYDNINDFGAITVNQFDGNIYMSGQNTGYIFVINSNTGTPIYSFNIGLTGGAIIYNPIRESIWSIFGNNEIVEIASSIAIIDVSSSTFSAPPSTITDNVYGTLANYYVPSNDLMIQTREYLRYPRENYSNDVQAKYVWKFINDQVPNIFMMDISGSQLIMGTSYSYTGKLPLPTPVLNRNPNMDITRISDSTAQQTIFNEIVHTLDFIDSNTDITSVPVPMELFLGYNSNNEGWETSTLMLYKRENVSFSVNYNTLLNNYITLTDFGTYGIIQMDQNSSQSFIYNSDDTLNGFKVGQIFEILITDVTNLTNKYISYNNGKIFKVDQLYNNQIVVNYLSDETTGLTISLINESNLINNYPTIGSNTFLNITFTVQDNPLGSIALYGQTEIEDIRYKYELNNTGHNIDPDDVFIFKSYNINEQGVDWSFLNKKRKEMIMIRSQIFSYVGSYKAIINAINYFGYNDLVLYEYYRNIDINSVLYNQLFKVEIPDIFDNSAIGWTVNDYLAPTLPNPDYEDTNLFNLTYLITDFYGNNVLGYSLQEVLIKLNGLKNWLERKVIPITNKILDITGRTDFVGGTFISHKSYSVKSFSINENMTPIDFNINEAYLMPVNSNSTVYNIAIDFKASKMGTLPNYFSIFIKTYKTYKEWNPFTIYSIGDNIVYYNIIYQSAINNNYIFNPTTYNYVLTWNSEIDYNNLQLVNYNNHIYEYISASSSYQIFGTASAPTPAFVINSGTISVWLDISKWIPQNLTPIQTIMENKNLVGFTYSNTLKPTFLFYTSSVIIPDYINIGRYNFSIDSNIDPYITVEIQSDNGMGASFCNKKNYLIQGTSNISLVETNLPPIGPFVQALAI